MKDQFGYYGIKPPWGTLNAVDLNEGKIVWKRALGEYPELTKKGIPETGTQLFGGGIVTAGGLVFIGASRDEKFRAIDKNTGKTLWEYQLPVGGYATPATYEIEGRQFMVIGAGGGGFQANKNRRLLLCVCITGIRLSPVEAEMVITVIRQNLKFRLITIFIYDFQAYQIHKRFFI